MRDGTDDMAPPTRQWSVEGFEYFWSTAREPAMVGAVVTPDVLGRWPCASGPVAGRVAYVEAIRVFLSALPPFEIAVTDHARNGNVAFVRWVIRAKFPTGPDTMTGVDRLVLEEGFVRENCIHSDHPLFARLAETKALG